MFVLTVNLISRLCVSDETLFLSCKPRISALQPEWQDRAVFCRNTTQIEDILKEKLSFTHQTTPLCQAHYNKIHSYLHAPVECDSCNARPKKGEQYSRHCPNPDRINTYINNISNEPLALNDSSRICNSCYIFLTGL